MPIHIHPILRNREDAMQVAGLLSSLKSDAILRLRALEIQNKAPKTIPLVTYKINGFNYTPSPTSTGTP